MPDSLYQPFSANGMGWVPALPDARDYTSDHPQVRKLLRNTFAADDGSGGSLPLSTDLSQWCSPIESQGSIGSCTAHAAVGLVEFMERKAFGRHVDASRLFVYKVTRKLLGWTGDTGAYLKTAMKALVLFGAPPEANWKYDVAKYDVDPDAFLYALAGNYKSVKYFRVDKPGVSGPAALLSLKQTLASQLPCMFGFTCYSSLGEAAGNGGCIVYPRAGDTVNGGHAVMAVGYDDNKLIDGRKGAIKIRNSWGTGWGQAGYGWLPYDYFSNRVATDIWAIQSQEWVDMVQFN